MKLKLYSNYMNSAGQRVRIALACKELDYEYVSVRAMAGMPTSRSTRNG